MLEMTPHVQSNVAKVQTGISARQKRALRRLLRILGTAINDLAVAPRKAPQHNRQRLLYRRASALTDDKIESLVVELGPERVLRIVDRLTAPELPLPLVAAE